MGSGPSAPLGQVSNNITKCVNWWIVQNHGPQNRMGPEVTLEQQGRMWGHSLARIMVPYPGKPELTHNPSGPAREEWPRMRGWGPSGEISALKTIVSGSSGMLEILVDRQRSCFWNEAQL